MRAKMSGLDPHALRFAGYPKPEREQAKALAEARAILDETEPQTTTVSRTARRAWSARADQSTVALPLLSYLAEGRALAESLTRFVAMSEEEAFGTRAA